MTKDQYYLCDVARSILDWFDVETNKRDNFVNTILNHVKLIVNKLDGNEEKIFSSLNGGKVNLDGADLIRAILMTRAAKEKFRNLDINEKVNEFRVRMGIEIDSINLWWGDRNVHTYFEQFLPDKTIKQAKSGFNYNAFPINLLYMLYFESKKQREENFSFRFFEYGQDSNGSADDNHWEMYDEIMTLHHTMMDWYNDRTIYHYLGYLFFQFKKEVNFKDIHQKWIESGSKSQFRNSLKRMIIEFILNKYKGDSDKQTTNFLLEDLKKDIIETDNNWYEKNNLFNILILQDILHCINSQNIDVLNSKYFKPNSEDKEHIRSQTPRWKDETRNKKEWEDHISQFEGISDDDKQKLKSYLPKDNSDLNDEQVTKIVNAMNQFGLNSIGNMVLLDSAVNRGYKNADYLHKRSVILSKYYSGTYIRPHTLHVFMKGNSISENDQNKWFLKDINNNAQNIYKAIETWINTK